MGENNRYSEIYLAGGCFWGTEKYISAIRGVVATDVGYANGNTLNPSYEEVCYHNTGHAETVHVVYDSHIVSLDFLLKLFYECIDPTTVDRQGGDKGHQYRTGIYYNNEEDKLIILNSIENLQKNYKKPIMIEVKPINNYTIAEKHHQKYLDKNPNGYCHIGNVIFEKAKQSIIDSSKYYVLDKEKLKNSLNKMQYDVTQKNGTEPPFENEYWDFFEKGIYVDITSGEPLFVSSDKFESGCGWPSFSKPIDKNVTKEKVDSSHGMIRTEVRSSAGDAHLGHVFEDGIKALGGKRYCINSAALKFISESEMEEKGYEYLLPFIK